MAPNKHKDITFHPLHYLFVLAGACVVLVIEIRVPLFANGLIFTPFVLVTTLAAMRGSFVSGIFAIAITTVAVDYAAPPVGFRLTEVALFKTLEYALVSIVIFLLAWRGRQLHTSNEALRNMTEILQSITVDLQAESRGNEKQLKKLNTVNKELVSIVNKFVEDDDYWARKLTTPIAPRPRTQTPRKPSR